MPVRLTSLYADLFYNVKKENTIDIHVHHHLFILNSFKVNSN